MLGAVESAAIVVIGLALTEHRLFYIYLTTTNLLRTYYEPRLPRLWQKEN
jgi:hypothetical protein